MYGAFSKYCVAETLTLQQTDIILQKLDESRQFYEYLKEEYPVWPQMTCLHNTFREGDTDVVILVMRRQLIALGFLSDAHLTNNQMLFDADLKKSLCLLYTSPSPRD